MAEKRSAWPPNGIRLFDSLRKDEAEKLRQKQLQGIEVRMDLRFSSGVCVPEFDQRCKMELVFFHSDERIVEPADFASVSLVGRSRGMCFIGCNNGSLDSHLMSTIANWPTIERQIPTDRSPPFTREWTQPTLEVSTGSDRSLAFCREWINTCVDSHQECFTDVVTKPPTRLIELFNGGPRLCIPGEMRISPSYVTLSHRWETLEILKLKKSNISSLSEQIPVKELCKTFLDAIVVTRSLGFSYLWIDSLCIVQDDEDDWHQESALMSEVYGNAVVNLAATHARDGSAGLFAERNVSRVRRQYVRTKTHGIFELIDNRMYERCLTGALSSRGWVFQERYLARRIIHFTAEQIFCECQHHTVCESWPTGILDIMRKAVRNPFPKRNEQWSSITDVYTRTELTFPKDKLIALCGIARYFQDKIQDEYIAGLWRTNLEKYLCWRVETYNLKLALETPLVPYLAPSWSWASINQPPTWKLHTTNNILEEESVKSKDAHPVIDILELDLQPAGADLLGQLQDARLKVKCRPLINARVIPYLRYERNQFRDLGAPK
jgi:hypothetical protein